MAPSAASVPPVIAEAMGLAPAQFDQLRAGLRALTDSVTAYSTDTAG